MMRKITLILSCLLMAILTACSTDQKPASPSAETKAAKVEAPEYISGRTAFQKLFVTARSFAADIKPIRLTSNFVADAPTSQGKAGIWRGDFASPSMRQSKAYTWSGVTGTDLPERGISHGTEDSWNPYNATAQVWDIPYLKIDTDKVYEVAQKHGGEALTKKDAKQPVMFILDFSKKDAKLLWHVVYGTSPNDAKLRIAVDASTGDFVRNEH